MAKRRPSPASAACSSEETPRPICKVVGIGASAGGLEAFSELLRNLPTTTGFSFALVQHLDPHHPSQLSTILQRATKMPVAEAEDGGKVEPNHIYVMPPNRAMQLEGDVLRLTPRKDRGSAALPVDEFMVSLADGCSGVPVGVVLSGTASDGTEGLKAIKAAGGITFAQDENSAKYSGMPNSAVAAGCVDYVLPPAKIARELARIASHPFVREPSAPPIGDGINRVYSLLRDATGVDFTQYKQTTLNRRLRRRMVVHRIDDFDEYADYLAQHPDQVEAAYQDVLIHVTSFFREPESFEAMRKHVFPGILKNRKGSSPIRIWLPGCSTGEEVYSIAISLVEFLDDRANAPEIQIFGTDVSDRVVEQARKGIFGSGIEADVSPERLRRFFTRIEQGWQINKSIRDRCIFARQNLMKDPPFSKIDLLSCRNVLIYFEAAAQKKLMPIFHYALRPGGFLLLGSAESIAGSTGLFESIDSKNRIFVCRHTNGIPHFETAHELSAGPELVQRPEGDREIWSRLELQREADRTLLARYCPPAIVVAENMEIVQFRGRVTPFLEPAAGEASLNLFRMTRPAIEFELRSAINRSKKSGGPVRKENIRLGGASGTRLVHIDVLPLGAPDQQDRCFVVLFEEKTEAPPQPAAGRKSSRKAAKIDAGKGQLEDELVAAREHLQAVVEENEATTEELRSANEEIQSSNEELQSTNEELETVKEEVQSANEELTTINEELLHSNRDLSGVNNDLRNLLRSVNIPMVMLDRELRIRRFTPLAEKMLKLLPSDVGRPITDLRAEIELPGLELLINEVIDNLAAREMELQDRSARWWKLVIRPYETDENKITGVVFIFFDIDAHKREAEHSRLAIDYAAGFIDTIRGAFLVLDEGMRVKWATEAFYRTFRVKPRETEGKELYALGNGQWDIPELRTLLEKILPKKSKVKDFEVTHTFPNIGEKRIVLNARRLAQDIRGKPLILLSLEIQNR